MRSIHIRLAVMILLLVESVLAQPNLSPRPPMGWNSWDAYGTTVTEVEVKANADYMAKNLSKFGWSYVVVDIQWYEPNAKAGGYRENAELVLDEYGRLLPAVNRFPSTANGKRFQTAGGLHPQFGFEIRNSHHARHSTPSGASKSADPRNKCTCCRHSRPEEHLQMEH